MKHIANGFTLLNLIFGGLAIIAVLQSGLTTTMDDNGMTYIILPEKIYLASVFIGCAAIIDFFDGFVARLLKISSPMGMQLDSLADVVSFGVAPGMIVYQFLRLSFSKGEGGLDINELVLVPALLLPAFGAVRLARFNLDTSHSPYFKGVPIPAVGLLIASFPLIYWHTQSVYVIQIFTNPIFWYASIAILCFLMVSTKPMLSLKMKCFAIKKDWPLIALALIAIISGILTEWLAVPIVFIAYLIFSLTTIKKQNLSESL